MRGKSNFLSLLMGSGLAMFFATDSAHATFHLWSVTELYSSADGSVQFIELSTTATLENALAGHVISCNGPQGTHTFTFPSNLSTTDTANKTFLIGTTNLAHIPGGVTPDYVFTNTTPFLFINGSSAITVGIVGSLEPPAVYTNLPTDGSLSLNGSSSNLTAAVNTPKNFNSQSNTIVPVKFSSDNVVGTNFVMTFPTAKGVNGSSGTNYNVDFKNSLSDATWTLLTTVIGDGTSKSVTNAISTALQRSYRLHAP